MVRTLEFLERGACMQLHTLERVRLEPDPDERGAWLARIAIGPTYRLRVPQAGAEPLVGWTARLIETNTERESTMGAWLPLQGDPPFLRCPGVWQPGAKDSAFRVQLARPDGTSFGVSRALDRAVGLYPGLVEITTTCTLATLRGRCIDAHGRSVRNRARAPGEFSGRSPLAAGTRVRALARWLPRARRGHA